jgi:hypothetical protein
VLDDAFAAAVHTDEDWFACEMYIVRAGLITRSCLGASRSGERVQARRHLHRALRAATELQSPSLRLRAANALSPLLRDQGRVREARELLGTVYAAFDEGFETADLAEARVELAQF